MKRVKMFAALASLQDIYYVEEGINKPIMVPISVNFHKDNVKVSLDSNSYCKFKITEEGITPLPSDSNNKSLLIYVMSNLIKILTSDKLQQEI